MRVKFKDRIFKLRGSDEAWTPARFDFLKRESQDKAKVVVLDDEGERYLIPIKDLERLPD